ncbi:hypothetical protein OG539_39270 [Actinacidiphila glaucinigra]
MSSEDVRRGPPDRPAPLAAEAGEAAVRLSGEAAPGGPARISPRG